MAANHASTFGFQGVMSQRTQKEEFIVHASLYRPEHPGISTVSSQAFCRSVSREDAALQTGSVCIRQDLWLNPPRHLPTVEGA